MGSDNGEENYRSLRPSNLKQLWKNRCLYSSIIKLVLIFFLFGSAVFLISTIDTVLRGQITLQFEDEIEIDDELWMNSTVYQLKEYLKCEERLPKVRQPYTDETWIHLRQIYESIVGKENSTIGDPNAVKTDAFGNIKHYSAQSSPEIGRGVFAGQFIPKGALVYDFSRSAQFMDGISFRKFNKKIESHLACDILDWAYVQDLNERDNNNNNTDLRIIIDLDDGVLCNDGDWEDLNNGENANVGYLSLEETPSNETWNNGIRALYAKRDIQEGEEFLCHYSQFLGYDDWWDSFHIY